MRFRKLASILTAGLMTLSFAEIQGTFDFCKDAAVFAASYQGSGTYEKLTYENYGSYVEITGCDPTATDVIIQDTIDGVKVTRIQENAFSNCTSLKSIIIPESVHSIRDGAFSGCSSLKAVSLPHGIRHIDPYTFSSCTSLEQINIPDSVTVIDEMAFYGCYSLKKITIPDSVTYIGAEAFAQVTGDKSLVTEINLSENLIYIGPSAFADCRKLAQIKIPDSLKALYMDTFIGCDSLKALTVPPSVSMLTARHVNFDPESSGDNISRNDIDYHYYETSDKTYAKRYDSPMYSNLFMDEDSGMTRVHYYYGWVFIENYNDDFSVSKRTVIRSELKDFGGFYSAEKYNFLVFGQNGGDVQTVDENYEVLRIVKYSKDWKRLDSASFTVSQTDAFAPFDAGSVRMDEAYGNLIIHTARQMYYEYPHQANLTVCINEETMGAGDLYLSSPYSSHSFGQFIKTDDDYAYYVDHGDAYPRAVMLSRSGLKSDVSGPDLRKLYVINIQGETGDNYTGLSIGGFELSDTNCLIAGNSVDHSDPESYDLSGVKNIFLNVSDKELKNTKQIWITDYAKEDGVTVRTPQFVKINDNKFLLMWEESNGETVNTKMVIVNGNGELLSDIYSLNVRLSDCHPVIDKTGKVVWYVTDADSILRFYRVDPDDLKSKAEVITAADPRDCLKEGSDPLADPLYIYDYEITDDGVSIIKFVKQDSMPSGDITDLTVPDTIEDLPVTEIGAGSFSGAVKLVSVTLPGSIKSIGNSAFSDCISLTNINIPHKVTRLESYTFFNCNLKSLVIPASVGYIGRYAVGYEEKFISNNDGSYSYSIAKDPDFESICGKAGSAAEKYALSNNISFSKLISGDLNHDGSINIIDAVMIKKWIICADSQPSIQDADINNDGTVNIFDLMRLMQNILDQ